MPEQETRKEMIISYGNMRCFIPIVCFTHWKSENAVSSHCKEDPRACIDASKKEHKTKKPIIAATVINNPKILLLPD